MAARSRLTKSKRRQMTPGGDLFQGRRDGGTIARRCDRRGGADVHEIDHRYRRVRFGERGDDRRERARTKSGSPLSAGNIMPRSPAEPSAVTASDENPP